MKKTYLFILAAGLVGLIASCNKAPEVEADVEAPAAELEKVIIRAGIEGNGTKVSIDGSTGAFSWTVNDQIAVYTSDGWKLSNSLGTAGATADFSFTDLVDANRLYYAVYPHNGYMPGTVNENTLSVTYPTIYNLSNLQSEDVPMVMVAKNASGEGLSFKHVGAILRLTVKEVPKGAKYLFVNFLDKVVTGSFSVSGLDSDPFEPTVAVTDGASQIQFTLPSDLSDMQDVVLNIPVPTGELGRIKVTAEDFGRRAFTNPLTITGPTLARAHGKKVEMYLPNFSVSATKKVIFSPGNLQATTTDYGANWTWKFAENQYDMITGAATVDGKMHISTAAGSRDYFRWSTSKAADYGINAETADATYYDYVDNTFVDWGTNAIKWGSITYPANTWRTLGASLTYSFAVDPKDIASMSGRGEWEYLFEERAATTLEGRVNHTEAATETVNNVRFVMGKIDGSTRVYILFPDHFTYPEDLTAAPYLNKHSSWWRAEYTAAEWSKLEAAGAVAIPVDSTGSDFYYTSTYNAGDASGWGVNFLYLSYLPSGKSTCSRVGWGRPYQNYRVRLVRDVN